MHIVMLVVTTDEDQRARLLLLFEPVPGDRTVVALRFAKTLEEAGRELLPVPDLLLLVPANNEGPGVMLPLATAAFSDIAIVIVGDAIGIAGTRWALTTGRADDVMLSSDLRAHTFERFATAIERARARERERNGAALVLAAIADAVITTDKTGSIAYCNDAACSLTVRARDEMLGLPIGAVMALHTAETLAVIEHPIMRVMRDKQVIRLPPGTVMVRTDGSDIMIADSTSPIVAIDGKLEGAVMVFHDITAAHQLRREVDHLISHDFLTGLPNRYAAQLHLNEILNQADANGQGLAVMYLDLDNFKSINDTLGHAAGDHLLSSVAARLQTCCRSTDMVSRQGGDEFLILMASGTHPDESRGAAQRMLDAVAMPHLIDGETILVGCSIGIALYPEHGLAADTLLQHADTALHAAKVAGRNTFYLFQEHMLDRVTEQRVLENALRIALNTDGLELFYQPKVCLANGAIRGCESLLRWRYPDSMRFAPADVIRCAEQSGLIIDLGRWVLREAMRQARAWLDSGLEPVSIAINVSALELRQVEFVAYLESCMAQFGIPASALQIELTESTLMRDVASAVEVLHRLKALGMSIAIDDFGTGYSNLSCLADIPIDLLKVDRSFVHGIVAASPRRQGLLRAVLSIAANLGVPTIAEGIETAAEAHYLMTAGCRMGQGFFYSPAISATAFKRLLSQQGFVA
jgi:diguanylate cyclase (GGDEF)-like protein/PAS domain S-box-containing protein